MQHLNTQTADDGSLKLLFELEDGARVEGVLLPGIRARWTFCVSSQVGCGIGCTFCATGTMGLGRNLRAGEIMAQIHHGIRYLRAQNMRMSHVVFMGMGEPLQNYENVRAVIRILTDTRGPCLNSRRITLSTVGIPRQMRRFAEDFGGRVQLALSLHAGTDETRQRIIPLARTHSLQALRAVCQAHPLPGSRHLMLEYVVLPGVNDTPIELHAVAQWMKGIRGVINLVPFNPFPSAQFRSPTTEEVLSVRRQLDTLQVPATIRWPRGRHVSAACGQLALDASVRQVSRT
ncbi:MAG: 23S rRNA (adenine(2503)-C(2))-methyltransferase RlmN [Myxococcota bacterium]|nr:23S rRNA (adenine(2503)-C(2))-methyltransferase RlmN [Myxococcota bacterium]